MITDNVVEVVVIRYAAVDSPKAKAIGTPSSTAPPTSTTKNTTRFQLPIAFSAGMPRASSPAITASTATISATSRQPCRARRSRLMTSIRPIPTSIA